jgi:ABC-type uncharacterized transport system permease subunit
MTVFLAAYICILAYICSAGLWYARQKYGLNKHLPQFLSLTALAFHALTQGLYWQLSQGPDLHFFAALSWISLAMSALTFALTAKQQLSALGIVVFPIAALSVWANMEWGTHLHNDLDGRLQMHASFALLAYASLSISALIAVLYWMQDRALRRRHLQHWMSALPPLVQTEQLLFKLLAVSWLLLSLTLLSGALFVEDMLAQHLWHKTVLTILSWLTLLILLIGRLRYGWRGVRAVHWTLGAMALLALAFFGSKFVLEMVL